MLGGRVAEELVYDDVTTGAEEDLRQATELARNMVARWGMSDSVGLVSMPDPETVGAWPLGGGPAPDTLAAVDREVRRMLDEAHAAVHELLGEHRTELDRLAHALLERESLDEPDAYAAAGLPRAAASVG
jgi:cell division protease FtsH